MPTTASAPAPSNFRRLLFGATALMLALSGAPIAGAQSSIFPIGQSGAVYRGTRGAPYFPELAGHAAIKGAFPQPHLNPVGKPCIDIYPSATAQIINRSIYDHNILISNQCSQRIRVSVCYYQTRTCSMFPIPAYARQLKLFGIFPQKDFRIEYREYLN